MKMLVDWGVGKREGGTEWGGAQGNRRDARQGWNEKHHAVVETECGSV